ncbi:sensor domain-containing phosphodiesterase [Xylophilus sp. Leaf220]|uniref:bifunctional diguanylate cyclase/phosphodiesterase n=1 Tax=Xylophilus sp. Leaf220 TaxID=1735686 RepID=UPI000AB7085A|nr:sensor domain-containing phosphodiesterase [Xylophilus sp. Leaf220]
MQLYPASVSIDASESDRLAVVQAARLLESSANEPLMNLARLASALFRTPIALVSLLDAHWQWLKASVGVSVTDLPRAGTFCDLTVQKASTVVIEDAHADPALAANAMVQGDPHIRFYAGAPLVTGSGFVIGTFCIAGPQARSFSATEVEQLVLLARMAMTEIDLQLGIGRRNDVTNLPNRSQLSVDLADLCQIEPDATRSLVLLEIMHPTEVQRAVRAVGIAPLERTLRDVAALLQSIAPAGARTYHVSETRFALLVDGAIDGHLPTAESLVRRMREPFESNGVVIELQACAGAVNFRLSDRQAGDALRCASAALYEAELAEQLIVWHRHALDAEYRRTFSLLRDLPIHLADGRLRLVYQPKLDLGRRRYRSVEALLRWDHPELGPISPAVFIPLIEGTSLIHSVTQWVLATGFAQQAQWRREGFDIAVAVNISARNLDSPDFLQRFQQAFQSVGLTADQIHIECTETAMMTEKKAVETLRVLHSLGVHIALDDFGVGYSNLGALQDLPATLMKIDRSLVGPIASDATSLRLFRSIVTMAKSLGYRVLAEGVETEQVLALAAAAGCDGAQGYFMSRPLEADMVAPFLRTART